MFKAKVMEQNKEKTNYVEFSWIETEEKKLYCKKPFINLYSKDTINNVLTLVCLCMVRTSKLLPRKQEDYKIYTCMVFSTRLSLLHSIHSHNIFLLYNMSIFIFIVV